jgi:outer membrane beta-barrel protein
MKRRFVSAILATLCAAGVFASSKPACAQEIQLTGPLKGAPAVRHLRLYRQGRLELAPSVSFTLLDEYRRTILIGGQLNYNLLDWLAIGVWGAGGAISTTTDLANQIDTNSPRDPLTATNINHSASPSGDTFNGGAEQKPSFNDQTAKISYVVAPQLTFTPFRGKLAIFNKIFVDTDFYVSGGVGFVGLQERGDCGAAGQLPCNNPKSFALTSTTKIAPTFGVGLKFYPAGFWSLGVEYRALPFAWNRAGFDERGSGPGNNFPDQKINSDDETFQFNQLVTISLGFYFPFQPKLTD